MEWKGLLVDHPQHRIRDDEAGVPALGDLVARARDGDQNAMGDLLDRYRPLIARTVWRYSASRDDLAPVLDREDVWQEATYGFLLLVRHYDPVRGTFGSYVQQFLPWHMRRLSTGEPWREESVRDIEDSVAVHDPDSATIRELLTHLSPRQAEILDAMYLQGLPALMIARRLDVTPRAVHATHRRGLDALRLMIEREDDGDRPDGRRHAGGGRVETSRKGEKHR